MDKPGAPLEKKSEQTNSAPTPSQPTQSSQTNQNLTTESGGIIYYLRYLKPLSYFWSSSPAAAPAAKPLAAFPAVAFAILAEDYISVELTKETAKNETIKKKEEEDLIASFINVTIADVESPKKTYKEILEAGLVSKEVVKKVEAEVVEAKADEEQELSMEASEMFSKEVAESATTISVEPIESVRSSATLRSSAAFRTIAAVRSSAAIRSNDTSRIEVTEPNDFERRPHSISHIPGRTPARFLPLASASPRAPEPSKGTSQKIAKLSKPKRKRNLNKWRTS